MTTEGVRALDSFSADDDAVASGMRSARCLAIGMIGVVSLTNIVIGGPIVQLIAVAAVLAGLATLAAWVKGPVGPIIIGIALAGQTIVFTASFAGHPWQIDSHMLFFVILAVVALMQSVPALVVTAGVVALHHLSFGILVPALVFPSVDVILNIERVALHAVIVVIEVGFLSAAILSRARQDRAKQAARMEAVEATARAQAMAAEATALRAQAEAVGTAELSVTTMLGHNLHAMARQDLSARMTGEVPEQFKQLARDYNEALETVSRTLAETLEMVGDVEAEATASADMTDDMAHQLEGQAMQVTRAAEAMRSLTASLEKTSRDIITVRDRAADAASKATEGGGIVRKAVVAMSEIKASSGKIEKIIEVIEEISFQTNLLALNAGVEAARAGQAGAGFAVVASEVRALSHRTSEAANQVKTLITSSVSHVANGSNMVDQAVVALDEIERTIADASVRVTELSHRAIQQAGAVHDVSQNLANIDTGIQSSAAKTEELSTIGTRVMGGAAGLNARLGGFVLRAETNTDWPAMQRPRPAA